MAPTRRAPIGARPHAAAVTDWSGLRLKDRIKPGVRVLFVGINPGVRSARTGHHFAGFSNRFWRLLAESRLLPEPLTFEQDDRLPEFGFGITNLVARPSPGINDLKPAEYLEGWTILDRKIRRCRPQVVAFVGVTLYRALRHVIETRQHGPAGRATPTPHAIALGEQPAAIHGARVFVLPNPSGRNANFTYAEMLAAFEGLAGALTPP